MTHEPDVDRTVAVSDDDVRVEKSFARDEFPVPAIKFRLVSESDDPAYVRLVDRIPEDFPMESIGFHPDYESDNWTAYKDHRVEYERTLEPGESTVTVYGIRLEEPSDVAGFLGEPVLERPPAPGEAPEDRPSADVDDILGADRSQLVRDALQGNGRLANPDPPADPTDAEPAIDADEEPAPRAVPSDLTPAVRTAPESVAAVGTGNDADADADGSSDDADAGESSDDADADEFGADADDPDDDAYVDIGSEGVWTDAAPEAGTAAEADGGLAATLAAEIRAGDVSEADLETLRGELDPGLPRSADVRIRRLQSQLADLEAYTDAIEEFIDDKGTGAELVERLDTELEAVTAELETLHDGLDAAADGREKLRGGIDTLGDDLAATDERLDAVDETAAEAVDGVDDLHDRVDATEDHLEDADSDIDSLLDDVDSVAAEVDDVAADLGDTDEYVSQVDDDLREVRESLSADIADLRAEVTALTDELERIDAIEDEIADLQTFRDRLNSAFGPGGDDDGADDDGESPG